MHCCCSTCSQTVKKNFVRRPAFPETRNGDILCVMCVKSYEDYKAHWILKHSCFSTISQKAFWPVFCSLYEKHSISSSASNCQNWVSGLSDAISHGPVSTSSRFTSWYSYGLGGLSHGRSTTRSYLVTRIASHISRFSVELKALIAK